MATATTTLALTDGNSATCWPCWRSLADALRAAEGIKTVTREYGDLLHPALIVTYDADSLSSDAVARLVNTVTELQATMHDAHSEPQTASVGALNVIHQGVRGSLAPTSPDEIPSLSATGSAPGDR